MSRREITLNANAKINLTLDLTGRLPDGYHAIYTVMQSITLCDTVTVALSTEGVALNCSDPSVPTDGRNTAVKAAEAYYAAMGQRAGAEIFIEKRIPSQAGMAGGSADAAAVLRCLDSLFQHAVSEQKLLEISLDIGADVPFCVTGGTRLCLNKGEIMSVLPPFSAHVVVAKPDAGVSTAAAFKKFDAATALPHPENDDFLFYFSRGDYAAAFPCAGNLFEHLTQVDEGEAIKRSMRENGAYYASMTGSGSSYFGLFESAEDAARAARALRELVSFVAVCKTADKGVAEPPAPSC